MHHIYDFWAELKNDRLSPDMLSLMFVVVLFIFFIFGLALSLSGPSNTTGQADRFILEQTGNFVERQPLAIENRALFAKIVVLSVPYRAIVWLGETGQLSALRIFGVLVGLATLYFVYLSAKNVSSHPLLPLLATTLLASTPQFLASSATLATTGLVAFISALWLFSLTEVVAKRAQLLDLSLALAATGALFWLLPDFGLRVAVPALVGAVVLAFLSEFGAGLLNFFASDLKRTAAALAAIFALAALVSARTGVPAPVSATAESLSRPIALIGFSIGAAGQLLTAFSRSAPLPTGSDFFIRGWQFVLQISVLVGSAGLLAKALFGLFSPDRQPEETADPAQEPQTPNLTFSLVFLLALLALNWVGLYQNPFSSNIQSVLQIIPLLTLPLALGLSWATINRRFLVGDLSVLALITAGLAADLLMLMH